MNKTKKVVKIYLQKQFMEIIINMLNKKRKYKIMKKMKIKQKQKL